jgi:hypothetical protein
MGDTRFDGLYGENTMTDETKFEGLFEQLRQEILRKLGLPESAGLILEVTFAGQGTPMGTILRIPSPGVDWLDYQLVGMTGDILAEGDTVDKAIENVCSDYKNMAHEIALKNTFIFKEGTLH